jgi:hypothetical protein
MSSKTYLIALVIYSIVITYDTYVWLRNRKTEDRIIKKRRIASSFNLTLFVLSFSLIIISILYHVNFLRYQKPIEHADSNTISLRDFKGIKLPGQSMDGVKEFAFIVTSFDCQITDDQINLRALFHPSRSYVFNEKAVDKFLLQHEIYHFHITEYFARLIRKELSLHKKMPSRETVDDIIYKHKNLLAQMQFQYDNESYHSYILKKQKLWEKRIDSLLSVEHNFRTTAIYFK